MENLSIRKGTLTGDERKIIENPRHHDGKIWANCPFPRSSPGAGIRQRPPREG
jgi:hypothetical protein